MAVTKNNPGFRFPADIVGLSAEAQAALTTESVSPANVGGSTKKDIGRYLVALAQRAPTTNVTTAINALKALLASDEAGDGAAMVSAESGTIDNLGGDGTVQDALAALDTLFEPSTNVAVVANDATGTQLATAINGILTILQSHQFMAAP